MKNLPVLLFLASLMACGHTQTTENGPAKKRGGGRSVAVTVSASAIGDPGSSSIFLVPKDEEDPWNREDKRCVLDLYHALEQSGFRRAESASAADLVAQVDLPPPAKASGLNLIALMGGFRHSVGLSAKDKAGKEAWRIQAWANQELEQRRLVFPMLALAMLGRFGTGISGEETVHVDEFDPRLEAIQAP